ncbi:MAG: fumarylacetoacetate hydrolase family protein [Candidatus Methylomirabilia bacterium]
MRFVRFQSAAGRRWGVVEGDRVREVEGNVLERWRATERTTAIAGLELLPPCEPSKIVALGLNYKSHALEVNMPIPEDPSMFLKATTALIGPGEPIVYPKRSNRVDYEAELACVIRKPARRVSRQDALSYVWGYTCLNDVTARDIQFTGGNFLNLTWSKGYDTFCPVGPWVVADEINPDDVLVQCYVNGEQRQSASTSDFIFPMADQIVWLSNVMTLLPGDVVTTGTPAGIGPMQVGDVVEVRIAGIGSLRNPIAGEE